MKWNLVADKLQRDKAVLIKLLKCIKLLLGITNSICIMDQGLDGLLTYIRVVSVNIDVRPVF
jgi:hypothetical protein